MRKSHRLCERPRVFWCWSQDIYGLGFLPQLIHGLWDFKTCKFVKKNEKPIKYGRNSDAHLRRQKKNFRILVFLTTSYIQTKERKSQIYIYIHIKERIKTRVKIGAKQQQSANFTMQVGNTRHGTSMTLWVRTRRRRQSSCCLALSTSMRKSKR